MTSALKRQAPTLSAWATALLIPAFALVPALFSPIESHAHDAATLHVYRAVLFSAARAEGWLFPVWSQALNAGLGGPLFSFYPPLLYFLMDAGRALGLSPPLAFRVVTALSLLAASTGAFALVRALGGRTTNALVAASVFVYTLPLLRDLFERGSPQGLALALSPWAVWGVVRAVQRPGGWRVGLAAALWALVILAHNLSALLLLPLLLLAGLWIVWERGWRRWWLPPAAIGAGILLASFSVLPFLAERQFVQLDNLTQVNYVNVAENPLRLRDLLDFPPVYDAGLDNNAIGDHLGPLPALILLLGCFGAVRDWRRGDRRRAWLIAGAVAVGLGVLWLQTASANWLWRAIPALAPIQFRTRLLGLAALAAAAVSGLLSFSGRWPTRAVVLLGPLAVLFAWPVLYPELQFQYATFSPDLGVREAQEASLARNVPGLTAFNEFLPRWRYEPITPADLERVEAGPLANLPEGGRLIAVERRNRWQEIRLETPRPFTAQWHLLYFPGWTAYLDGERRPLRPMEATGYALLEVPAGAHTVTLRYEGTAAQRVGGWLSGLAALGLLLLAAGWRPADRPPAIEPAGGVPGWLPLALLLLVALKGVWLDPQTTLFRQNSTCAAVAGANVRARVRFGRDLYLCGYQLDRTTFRPGDWLEVTLYWQAAKAPDGPADSFVHLLGTAFNPETGDPLWGQQDKQLPGDHPVTDWRPGKLYRDVYRFRVPPHTPPGPYQLEIGWLEPETGQRLAPVVEQPAAQVSVSHLDALLVSGLAVE